MASGAGAEVEAVEGFTQAVTLVKQQRVDATVNDNLAVLEYFKTTGDDQVKIAAETGDTSEQVFALRPADTALRDAINEALDGLRADGTLAEISQRYFDTDVSDRRGHRHHRRGPGRGPEHLGAAQELRRPDGTGCPHGHDPDGDHQLRDRSGDRTGRSR